MGFAFLYKLLTDLQKHPAFSFIIGLGLVAFISYAMIEFARASDVEDFKKEMRVEMGTIKTDVCNIKNSMARDSLEQRVFDLESQIFQLELIEKSGTIQTEQLDRLSTLRSRLNKANRDLQFLPSQSQCNRGSTP